MRYAFKNDPLAEEDATVIKKFIEDVKNIGKPKQKKDARRWKEQPPGEVKLEEEDPPLPKEEEHKEERKERKEPKEEHKEP
jgi:hypothetical protein